MANYNPYATPSPGGTAPPAAAPPPGGPALPWETEEVLAYAWASFKACWAPLVAAQLVTGLFTAIPELVPMYAILTKRVRPYSREYFVLDVPVTIVALALHSFFQVGLTRMWLAVARGKTPELAELFGGGRRYPAMLASTFLVLLAVWTGSMFCIVPGVILGLGLTFSSFFVVDQELGPTAAMRASWRLTLGHKAQLFGLVLMCMAFLIGGLLACYVGLFVAVPAVGVALSVVYLRLTGEGTPPPAVPMLPPFAAPPAY